MKKNIEKKKLKIKNIDEEISHKIKSLNVVRNNRIMLSKRMGEKSSFWNTMFFMFNIMAICFFIVSLSGGNEFLGIVSGTYAIYIILLQYTINLKGYNEKHELARRNEILIEHKIIRLKNLQYFKMAEKSKVEKYNEIMIEYLKELEYFPNHCDIDLSDEIYKELKGVNKSLAVKIYLQIKDKFLQVLNVTILAYSIYFLISSLGR